MTAYKMKDVYCVGCRKKAGQKNIYLQSMKGNRVLVCIVKMEMYCENRNVL